MLHRTQECLAADDVTIQCRVRYSEQTLGADREGTLSEPRPTNFTMRVWHRTKTPTASSVIREVAMTKNHSFDFAARQKKLDEQSGPELLLEFHELHPAGVPNPVVAGDCSEPISMSDRFSSFGSGNARSSSRPRSRVPIAPLAVPQKKTCDKVIIPLADITAVEIERTNPHQCNITTKSTGYFELIMENGNGRDILLVFLKARLPNSRVFDGLQRTGSELSHGTKSTATKSFDVEAFTAHRMTERMKKETMSEKLRRKVFRVISSLEDLSASLTECSCGCDLNNKVSPDNKSIEEIRDNPPSPSPYDHLERAPDRTPYQSRDQCAASSKLTPQKWQELQPCCLPSGLSVEEESERFN